MNEKQIPARLDKSNVADIVALTPMQEGLLFHYLKEQTSELYFEQLSLEIPGIIDVSKVEKAWSLVSETNEMLRTVFRWENVKNPVQLILKKHGLDFRYHEIGEEEQVNEGEWLEAIKANDLAEGFDLAEVPFRITICRPGNQRWVMMISNHHILYDGWSNGILLNEFLEAYNALSKGEAWVKKEKTAYKQYVKWLFDQDTKAEELYWTTYLQGFEGGNRWGVRGGGEQKHVKKITRYLDHWPEELKGKLEQWAQGQRITGATLLYGAWGILWQRYTGSDDVLFGVTVSGRQAEVNGIEDMVGLFINTLPLRVQVNDKSVISGFLGGIHEALQARASFESTPLVKIKEWSCVEKSGELFDTLVVIENYPLDLGTGKQEAGFTITGYTIRESTHYDFTVNISLFNGVEVVFLYDQFLFNEQGVKGIAGHFREVVRALCGDGGRGVYDIDMLTGEEKKQLVEDFNDTEVPYLYEKTIAGLFMEQAEKTPDRVAIMACDAGNLQVTYRQYGADSVVLADILRVKGVGAGTVVGIVGERSLEMMKGIMGILMGGGAYLPMDPGYPPERVNYMLADSQAKLLLTDGKNYGGAGIEKIDLNEQTQVRGKRGGKKGEGAAGYDEISRAGAGSRDVAYVIYTSGSTGRPKGVMVEHHSVVNRLKWMQKQYPLSGEDVVLQKTPITFDVSVWELFWWGWEGARLCLLARGGEKDPATILATVAAMGVTTMHFVPSMLELVLDEVEKEGQALAFKNVLRVFTSGEALEKKQVKKFFELLGSETGIGLINLYGPTEATVDVSYFVCHWPEVEVLSTVPIGKPIDNLHLYIMDHTGHVVPVGVGGELYIGGVGVARGYLNRPGLTAEKFVKMSLWPGNKMETLYKTGDLARWLVDGNIEFLGRLDFQVKIRGMRLELGEIESELNGHEAVERALVLPFKQENGETSLVGYIIRKRGQHVDGDNGINGEKLRHYLLNKLPGYMVPAYYIEIPELPLTANGKLDRRALPLPGKQEQVAGKGLVGPQDDIEKKIGEAWKSLLNLNDVSIDKNFFDLGGNSYTIIRLSSRLKEAFGRDVPVVQLFNYPTIRAQAAYIRGDKKVKVEEKKRGKKPVAVSGQDIAIIGMSGRFPGAKDIDMFWENLKNGVESIRFFERQELVEAGIAETQLDHPRYVRAKGVVAEVEYFDAAFFGFNAVEAELMDPQIRFLHECIWSALEDANCVPGNFPGSIGLYAGLTHNFHWLASRFRPGISASERFELLNLNSDYFSTLISYKLNLKGPSITLQTACSTSLVAVDMACQALVGKRCDVAIAAGAGITYPVISGYIYQEGMVHSSDGHCRAFDAAANGTVSGNGVAVVVLKPLEQALADGDAIHGVIKGSAANNDGNRKVGYTAPSVEGQVEVILGALEKAGIEPETIGYIETHGTGTTLGDPVEIEALQKAFGSPKVKKGSIAIGTVKSNIGHLDAAAGAAGLIKTVLAVKHGMIPASLHFQKANEHIDFANTPFYVNTGLREWPRQSWPRRAGVSSFGIGGTNAHVIVEEAPQGEGRGDETEEETTSHELLVLSARSEEALWNQVDRIREHLKNSQDSLGEIAYTLQVGRKSFDHRLITVAGNREQAIEQLSSRESRQVHGFKVESQGPRVVFMFPGQGGQYVNMSRELYQSWPGFRENMDRCLVRLTTRLGEDLKNILYPSSADEEVLANEKIKRPDIALPLLFSVEYSLAGLLMSLGVRPDAVIGYSFGEYTAACIAGIFSLEDALDIIVQRGELIGETVAGAMLSIPWPVGDVKELLKKGSLGLAIDNGPSCIVSGSVADIANLEQELKKKRCMCMRVNVPHPLHSGLMKSIKGDFDGVVSQYKLNPPSMGLISNVSGTWLTGEEGQDSSYWGRHLCSTVKFADGIRELLTWESRDIIFLEIGPGRDLTGLVGYHIPASSGGGEGLGPRLVDTLRGERQQIADNVFFLNKLGWLWGYGVTIHWECLHVDGLRRKVHLPTYPFARNRYWNDTILPGDLLFREGGFNEGDTGKKSDRADWFYLPAWKLITRPGYLGESRVDLQGKRVLVFFKLVPLVMALVHAMEQQGVVVIRVEKGEMYERKDGLNYQIQPGNENDYLCLIEDVKREGKMPSEVIHTWNLGETGEMKSGFEEYTQESEMGFYALLYFARSLLRSGVTGEMSLNVIADQVVDVSGLEETIPSRALLQGPCMVIPQEMSWMECRTIDVKIPAAGSFLEKELSGHLVAEIFSRVEESVVALRGGKCWVKTYEPQRLEVVSGRNRGLRDQGVYLLTGGTGYVGLTLARCLAETVQARLVLVSRSPLPPKSEWDKWVNDGLKERRIVEKIKKIKELEMLGAEVLVFSADVSSLEEMRSIFKQVEQQFGLVHGVIHAAGVVGDRVFHSLGETGREVCEEQFTPKVKGLLVLEKLVTEPGASWSRELDFCLLTSSLSPIIGGLGFTAYAAANFFMDAFAEAQNKRGKSQWISLNYEGWQLEKEPAGKVSSDAVARLAELLISPAEGSDVFKRVMHWGGTRIVNSTGDLGARVKHWVKGHGRKKTREGVKQERGTLSLRPALSTVFQKPGNELEEQLASLWQNFFGINEIGVLDDFFELGGDSLKAITMVARVQEQVGMDIPLTVFFSHSSIERLAGYITGASVTGPGEKLLPGEGLKPRLEIKYPARLPDLKHIYEPFALTHIQTAYLMGRSEHFEMGSISTHFYAEIDTQLNIERLTRAFNRVIERHPMLRAVVSEDGQQRFLDEIPYYRIVEEDLTGLSGEEQEGRILKERERMSHYMFNTAEWPLFEIKSFKLTETVEYLFIGFDLIIGDAASLERIAGELVEFYRHPEKEMKEIEFTFRDYMLSMEELRKSEVYKIDREYWLRKLDDFPASPALPLRCLPSEVKKPWFKRQHKIFTGESWEQLKNTARKMGITPSVLLCTAYVQVLAYWSNQPDFALNLTVFNRYPFHGDVGKIVGDFTSLVLLEVHLTASETFRETGRRIQGDLLEALEHRHFDGVELIREISRYRNLGTQAVMPVVYTSTLFESTEENFLFWDKLGDIKTSISQTSQVFLDNQVRLQEDELIIAWDYVEELFEPEVILTMFQHYIELIESLILGQGEYRPGLPARHQQLWDLYNSTAEDIPASLLHILCAGPVSRTPGAIAIENEGERMTYRELNEAANRVCHYLKEQGVGRGDLVAVLTPRSIETMVYVLGVVKSGAAYVPVEPGYPEDRQQYIYENSGCRLFLKPGLLKGEELESFPVTGVENVNEPGDLAYVIYTSGSTGRPKGVVITHREAANTIIDINRKFNVNEQDRILGISSMCFDLSVYDVFGAFSTGATLVLIQTQKDVEVLIEALDRKGISFWNSVPAILDMVVKNLDDGYVNLTLTRALLSGDWIPLSLPGAVRRHFPNCSVTSLGGATEGSIWSIYYPIGEVKREWKSIPYGFPLANQAFYVLNYMRELCPVQVPGELYIGGVGVAEGYMNDEEKTRQAFIQHAQLGKIYKTGDFGVFTVHGYIEFLGRKDFQVKIRGYRVELGEIETCLLEHERIKSAVVVDRVSAGGGKYLCAYVVMKPGVKEIDVIEVKGFISRKLPAYMIPTFIIGVERIPLTANGKVDRKALPEPDVESQGEMDQQAPMDVIQRRLVRLWQEVIKVETVRIHDDFFQVGGDSLKANVLVGRIRKTFNIDFPLMRLFRSPTVKELSEYIRVSARSFYHEIEPEEEREYFPLSAVQRSLFVLAQLERIGITYNAPIIRRVEGELDMDRISWCFRCLLERHEILRTSFVIINGVPVQRVHENVEFAIEVIEPGDRPIEAIVKEFVRPFDLSRPPLLRIGLVSYSAGSHFLISDLHHIISDGTSGEILNFEFLQLYAGEELPVQQIQYKDFALWQQRLYRSINIKKQEEYWLNIYSDRERIPRLDLPTDFPRPQVFQYQGHLFEYELSPQETVELKKMTAGQGVTLFMNLLAAFYVLLHKYSGQEDIVIGCTMAGRPHADLQRVLGMMLNELPIRNYPGGEKTYSQFLHEVKQSSINGFENQDFHFEELVSRLRLHRDTSRNPLFDVCFVFQNYERPRVDIPGIAIAYYPYDTNTSKFDMNLFALEKNDRLCFTLEYSTELFKPSTIERICGFYLDILRQVTIDYNIRIADIIFSHEWSDAATGIDMPSKEDLVCFEF